jgi:hypothetical protein
MILKLISRATSEVDVNQIVLSESLHPVEQSRGNRRSCGLASCGGASGCVARSLRIDSDMRPLSASPARTALPAAHFERNAVTIICETVH